MELIQLPEYNIYVGQDWTPFRSLLSKRQYSKILVIVDENTKTHCLPLLEAQLQEHQLHLVQITSGEQNKHIDTCQQIWRQFMNLNADRRSLVINLGGGVIGDMGGFCAATFKRGMDFIQVPTTLLSQVDASIGGKIQLLMGLGFAVLNAPGHAAQTDITDQKIGTAQLMILHMSSALISVCLHPTRLAQRGQVKWQEWGSSWGIK